MKGMKVKIVNPTKKQLELLKILNPHSEKKVSEIEAAEILGITVRAVEYRMARLKKRCPEIYENFKKLRKIMNRGQQAANNACPVDPVNFDFMNIIERF